MDAFKQLELAACNKLHLLNEATIILIPKKPDASEPKDFRPISLVCSFTKLVLKVLARRLQPRMAEIVGHVKVLSSVGGLFMIISHMFEVLLEFSLRRRCQLCFSS
jgi:hypothetical protein